MSYKIITSPNFVRELKRLSKKYPSLKLDVGILGGNLSENPLIGSPIGKGCFKIRLAIKSKNQGKSGGARVITCVFSVLETVVLLSIYDKSEKENITDTELKTLLKELGLD